MSAQTRGQFDALYDNVDKTLSAIMKDRLKELARIYIDIFNIRTSDRKFERVVTYVPFGDTQSKVEGDVFPLDFLRQGNTKDFIHTENGLGFRVTQTALEDDVENILNRAGTGSRSRHGTSRKAGRRIRSITGSPQKRPRTASRSLRRTTRSRAAARRRTR